MTGTSAVQRTGQLLAQLWKEPNGGLARNNVRMAYQLRILDAIADTGPGSLAAAVGAATAVSGAWERFVEVRMSADPTARITTDHDGSYEVLVN